MLEIFKSEKKGYGYEIKNPIRSRGTVGAKIYFSKMRHKAGKIVKIKKEGHIECRDELDSVDIYRVYVLEAEDSSNLKVYTLYVNIQNYCTSETYPEDFELAPKL